MMFNRRNFIKRTLITGTGMLVSGSSVFSQNRKTRYKRNDISDFAKRLNPLGRILELQDYYVWGCSPIVAPDGKFHVFFSRWNSEKGMGGWINSSEIAHAEAESPEGPFYNIETILAPRGEGYFDATTCHNPHIKYADGKYCLFYMGNSNGKTDTKRIALATADSLYGSWNRPDKPLLDVGSEDAWDNHCTSNPAFIKHPNGQYWLYYKSWNSSEYYDSNQPEIKGNRKYGLAIAENSEAPYIKYAGNPILDYSGFGENRQLEDGNVFMENGRFYMVCRDMGRFGHDVGIIIESEDGIRWTEPKIAYFEVDAYIHQLSAPPHLKKYGRFERPQVLIQNGKPTHLFVTSQGGQYKTSSPFVFEIGEI